VTGCAWAWGLGIVPAFGRSSHSTDRLSAFHRRLRRLFLVSRGLLQTFYEGGLLNVWTPLQANSRVDRGVASGDSGIWGWLPAPHGWLRSAFRGKRLPWT